jgi:hypothetical protein
VASHCYWIVTLFDRSTLSIVVYRCAWQFAFDSAMATDNRICVSDISGDDRGWNNCLEIAVLIGRS